MQLTNPITHACTLCAIKQQHAVAAGRHMIS